MPGFRERFPAAKPLIGVIHLPPLPGYPGSPGLAAVDLGPTMTVKEAAGELNCSISLVYRLMNARELAYERRGRRKLPTKESVAEFRRRNLVVAALGQSTPASPAVSLTYRHLFQRRSEGPG